MDKKKKKKNCFELNQIENSDEIAVIFNIPSKILKTFTAEIEEV